MALNVLMVAALPVLVWLWVRWVQPLPHRRARPQPVPAFVLWSFAVLVVGFGVVRNLPFGAALAP